MTTELKRIVSDDFNSDARDAERYRYIKKHYEWLRHKERGMEGDAYSMIGCKFDYDANFSCAAMIDHNIDKMIEADR